MKMKYTLPVLICAMLVLARPANASADYSDEPRVVDNKGILTQYEIEDLSSRLEDLSREKDMDIVLFFESATPSEYDSKYGNQRAMYYCADLYDYGGYTNNGLALLITVDERKWALVTEGVGDGLFPLSVQKNISDSFLTYLKDNDFSGAAYDYVESVENCLGSRSLGFEDEDDTEYLEAYDGTFANRLWAGWMTMTMRFSLVMAFVVGLVAAFIRNGILKSQLRSVRRVTDAANYVVPGSLELNSKMDTYLYTTQVRRIISTSDDSDGSFTGSSGDDHTGSTGDF